MDFFNIFYRHPLPTTFLAVSLVVLATHWHRIRSSSKLPLPPSPPGLPLLGSLPQFLRALQSDTPHLLIEKWAREYGEIIRVNLGTVTEYYVNSDKAVKALFDQKSAQTSERPRWIMSSELLCNEWNPLLLNASHPRWKRHRKVIHSELTSPARADAGLPFLDFETAKFLYTLAHDSNAGTSKQKVYREVERYTYSTFAAQSMGFELPESDDPNIDFIHTSGLNQILQTFPGSNIIDTIPWLNSLPLLFKPWERKARAMFLRDLSWVRTRMQTIKKQIDVHDAPDAFLTLMLKESNHKGMESEEEAGLLAFNLIIGAADTSQISTWVFLEAMMNFPDVQDKARNEIEKVAGGRLPHWNDLESIPYIRCLMKETWRWRPPVALGHPHRTTRDLEYNGMRIPRGARLHLNAWAISRDPNRYEQPDRFWPERFTNDHTTTHQSINSTDVTQRDHFAFGSGRRVCPGVHVADRSLATAIMRILWAFDIRPAPGARIPATAEEYPSKIPGIASSKLPVTLTVRSAEKLQIIDQTFRGMLAEHKHLVSIAIDHQPMVTYSRLIDSFQSRI